ncbi:MAG: DNA adenine methylase [Thermoanaerobaculia bacterium]
MGSKHRLLPWIHSVLSDIPFSTALDAFSGSGCVAYLLKAMGKQVTANDFMRFSATIARALVENPGNRLGPSAAAALARYDPRHRHFIERTFAGIFFEPRDLRFLDRVWWNLRQLEDESARAMALAALIRSCLKRQPRGVFTVAGDPERHKDGRRDLRLSIREHFFEQVARLDSVPFDSGRACRAVHGDVFEIEGEFDLVYLDPPYVPRSDDNCYMKRYHFLEGLSCYWEGQRIMEHTKVRKIEKPFTPFSYRRQAIEAFSRLFSKFRRSTIALSYSSNGFPDLEALVDLMKRQKGEVVVYERPHRYHFGTHGAVRRARVDEYLIIGH